MQTRDTRQAANGQKSPGEWAPCLVTLARLVGFSEFSLAVAVDFLLGARLSVVWSRLLRSKGLVAGRLALVRSCTVAPEKTRKLRAFP